MRQLIYLFHACALHFGHKIRRVALYILWRNSLSAPLMLVFAKMECACAK